MKSDAATPLRSFRTQLYTCFGRRRDALLDLVDALLASGPIPALVYLSLAPPHRRGWGSLYAALRQGQVDVPALRDLLTPQPWPTLPPIYAVDVSVWPRCDAETSAERGFYYHPSRHLDGKPVVKGWAYQWITQLRLTRDSWTAPVDVQRLLPTQNPTAVAAAQILALAQRRPPGSPIPLFVLDAGYSATDLAAALTDQPVALLIRLRSDRCFYTDPAPVTGPREGRPRRDGAKFACADPTTWPAASFEYQTVDADYGAVQVQAWCGLHATVRSPAGQGTYQARQQVRGTVLRVSVARLRRRTPLPQVLWLWWQGPGEPDLALLWRAYTRRFDIEHTFRLLKQTLNWVTPHLRTPEQADRWTWLVVAAYTQLRITQEEVAEQRLPWQRAQPARQGTPGRVRQSFLTLLPQVGTPAAAPNPCGRSPGRPQGRRSLPAPRYPALKKSA